VTLWAVVNGNPVLHHRADTTNVSVDFSASAGRYSHIGQCLDWCRVAGSDRSGCLSSARQCCFSSRYQHLKPRVVRLDAAALTNLSIRHDPAFNFLAWCLGAAGACSGR
jgi:hypothetical protein